jgi:hypothetical protein
MIATRGIIMTKIAVLTAAALALLTVAASAQYGGPYYGKGKAPPPPPVVTKGWASDWKGPAIVPVLYLSERG